MMEEIDLIKQIEEVKEKNSLDLTMGEDLSIALMNLVSLEEHSFFSYIKTNDEKFLKILENTRELRKKLLSLLVLKDDDSEKWCMSKHFLATSMRLYEVANRFLHDGKKEEAKDMYKDAAEMYGSFWQLNNTLPKEKIIIPKKEEKGIFNSIKKMLECCNE